MKPLSKRELDRRKLCGNALADFYGNTKQSQVEFNRIHKALLMKNPLALDSREKHIYYEVIMNIADPVYFRAIQVATF